MLLLAIGALTPATAASVRQAALPRVFEHYAATGARLNAAERNALLSGQPVVKLLDSDASKEVAVFGAVWIKASPARYIDHLKDIEQFERGGAFHITKRIHNPPRAEDFAAMQLSDDDLRDLPNCRLGKCELKLSATALQTLRRVDWRQSSAEAEATAIFRRLALEYVQGYLEGGNRELAVYRDKDRPTFVANELHLLIERVPALAASVPDLKVYLLDYPRAALPDSTDFLYWQETEFGLKPTIRINHVVIQQRSEQTLVASKMLYASHYFWTALEFRVLLPDTARGEGFWLITVNRSRSDGLGGFVGRMVRGRVRSEVQGGTLAALTGTKTRLEGR